MQMEESPIDQQDVLEHVVSEEVAYYTSPKGFLDFVRDCGAAPDATFQPHGRYCQDLIEWPDDRWKLTLWPRGSFKSQVFNVGMVAWEVAKNPDIRVLVCSETGKQAKEFVGKTMEIIDSTWFRERFGAHHGKRWRIDGFTSALRERPEIKEPTLQASGVGEVRTGMHWDMVLMDDVCSQENTRTPESIESLWYWFGETLAQLDPGCRLFVIGTLHHYADIYCKILEDHTMRSNFVTSIHAWRDPPGDPAVDNEGELFFPTRLTPEFVAKQKAFMPPRLFACFYENVPSSDADRIFRPEYFQVIPDEEIPSNVWSYILTDFAFTADEKKKKGKRDQTVFWVISLDVNRYAYVRDVWVGRWKASDSVRVACTLWNDSCQAGWNMKGMTVEGTTHKEILMSVFEEVRRQTFIHPKIIEIQGRSQEIKDMRIEASEPRWRRGEVYFSRKFFEAKRRWNTMFKEMCQWPFSEHDDIPDAQSDLDKRDNDGRYYCPAPPPGWRAAVPTRANPSTINGRFNQSRQYPADEMHRQDHQGNQGNQLWANARDAQGRPGNDIFRSPKKPPG